MTLPNHPASQAYLGIPGYVFAWFILLISLALFGYVLFRRYQLLRLGQPDPRFGMIRQRLRDLVVYGLIQKKQPRYLWAGCLHLMIFWGFVVLGLRSIDLVSQGLGLPFLRPLMGSSFGAAYGTLKDLFELLVLGACIAAILRRALAKPARYEGSHTSEAYLVLGLIAFLMVTDILYEGSAELLGIPSEGWLPAAQLGVLLLSGVDSGALDLMYRGSYWLHLLAFLFFLNFLPLGKHFHIITSLPNVFLRKVTKGAIKPARWDVADFEELESLGIGKFEDLTWKHILDLFTCTECGRCTDHCPATAVGRPLSPKTLTIALRDYGYQKVPLLRSRTDANGNGPVAPLIGGRISHEVIWSCTTCGACEEECPLFIEYIDKIVDMRRHLIESAQNPKAFNQVLMQFEKTGNPFGKPTVKRTDWIGELEDVPVKVLKKGDAVDVLYFVDSYGSYDPRVQAIAAAVARGLHKAGIDFGILGANERDSGHQVRRIGEEGLFQLLMEENLEAFKGIRFDRIVTTDPHAYNTLKKDYPESFDVFHYAPFFLSLIEEGRLKPSNPVEQADRYTYHDPCYLGRHNEIYEAPRKLISSLPGLNLVEMEQSKDRSFCCGGGDIILWHEIEQEEIRMAEKRIQMAQAAGANVIVTACPFCLIHFEDAIKTAGLEGHMRVIDLMELLVSTLNGPTGD
jgi:Fe-S oxidoreductase